jgi:predicted small lipoprotein YifL
VCVLDADTYLRQVIIMKKNVLLFFMAALFLASCGLKGPPLPPEAVVPERVTDLKVKLTDGGVALIWTMPTANTDGTGLADLVGFKVLRKDVPDKDVDCPPCTGKYEEIADFTLSVPGKAVIAGGAVLFTDASLSPSITYTYVVVSYNSAGSFSKTSNPVDVSLTRVK